MTGSDDNQYEKTVIDEIFDALKGDLAEAPAQIRRHWYRPLGVATVLGLALFGFPESCTGLLGGKRSPEEVANYLMDNMFYIRDVVEVGTVSHSSIGRRSGFVTLDVVDVNDAYPNSDLGDLLRITIDSIPTEELKAFSEKAKPTTSFVGRTYLRMPGVESHFAKKALRADPKNSGHYFVEFGSAAILYGKE